MEMMESFEETRIGPTHTDPCGGLHDVNVHEVNLAGNCAALMGNKQNFDFGAEIIETQTIVAEREFDVKTNKENIATTATMATVAVAASTSPDGKHDDENIETPLNVAELSQTQDNFVNNDGSSQANHNADDDDKDSGDSYQTDDDAEDDDANVESQQECSPTTIQNDASQESDDSTSDSDFSDLSGLSDMSGREWKPISARPINWVQKQIHAGANPRELLSQMLPSNAQPIAPGVNDMLLWRILASMLSEPPRRQKLRYINTFEDVIQLIQQSKNIIVLTGAGVSVSCGIPDFRSSDGIYSRLAKDFPNLPDPQAMFDINYFSRDPRPFFKFAREIYPGQFKPSPCHRFIKLLEEKNKLLRNYTQNIDTLEQVAGIKNVIECHGSFSTASCTKCKVKCTADAIREDIFSQRIPVCRRCQPNVHQSVNASDPVSDANLSQIVENGIMKPDIVFFGEGLPEEFHTVMASDKDKCDLLIVIGSSLKVRPVALIPSSIPSSVPQILINREQLHHLEFDVELLGDSDVIINQLCHRLGNDWKDICYDNMILKESKELLPLGETDTNDESEEDGQQMLDTDTQSVKSSASTDLALRSAGTYSDSGFESFTSSGMMHAKPTTTTTATMMANTIEANEAIEKIKSNMLELNHQSLITSTTTTVAVGRAAADAVETTHERSNLETVRVNYLEEEEPIDAVDFENRSFQPFNARVTEPNRTTTYGVMNARHLSIDSSKDSGIHGDLSNSAIITNIGTLPPPITNFGDSGGTTMIDELSVASAITTTTCADKNIHTMAGTPPTTTATETPTTKTTIIDASQTNAVSQKPTTTAIKKYRTASERLLEGTYYAHDATSAYVFPGAQVSWWSDAEDDDENNDLIANEFADEKDEEGMDANCALLSPLMPPSVEAEVVSDITTTTTTINNKSCSGAINKVDAQKPATATKTTTTSTTNKNGSIVSNITTTPTATYSCNGTENATERAKLAALPSSPQKRACECPSTQSNCKQQQTTTERSSNCNSSISSDDRGDGDGKCECSPPPLKRKRSIDDDENTLCVDKSSTTAHIAAAAEANISASTTNNVKDHLLTNGTVEMPTSTATELSLQQI